FDGLGECRLLGPRLEAGEGRSEGAAGLEHVAHPWEDYGGERLFAYGGNRARKGNRAKKISSGKSEDPPELSAGSSESEDLPDPTGGKLSRGSGRGQSPIREKSSQRARFSPSPRVARGEHPFACVGFRSCTRHSSRAVPSMPRSPAWSRGRSRPRSRTPSKPPLRRASTCSRRPARAPGRASPI